MNETVITVCLVYLIVWITTHGFLLPIVKNCEVYQLDPNPEIAVLVSLMLSFCAFLTLPMILCYYSIG